MIYFGGVYDRCCALFWCYALSAGRQKGHQIYLWLFNIRFNEPQEFIQIA